MTASDLSLLYTEDEDALRSAVRSLLEDRSPWSAVLARTESGEPYDADLWRRLAADVGVAALAVPEEQGGAGASWREVAVVAEELGRSVAPVPFLGGVLTTAALLAAGDEALLGEVASGARVATLAVPLTTAPGALFPVTVTADGDALTGTVTSVVDAPVADVLVVPALAPDGPALYAVEGARVALQTSLDLTRPVSTVTLDGAAGRRLDGDAVAALEQALLVGAAVLASEQVGLAEQCLATTVEHLKTRVQFGRKIGSFQALKHRCADLWVEITQARAVARYAAACVATGDADSPVAVAVAGAHCSATAVHAAEECVQMHGGTGFTWEHPAHLWLKRAKTSSLALGTAERHRARLATLVDLPPAP